MLWGGRNTANKYHWSVWGVLTVSGPHWVCPNSQRVCFPGLHCSGSRLLSWELSKVGPGLHALPRSKPLRFRLLLRYSTKAQTQLDLPLVPFPGPSSLGDQVVGEHSHPQVWCVFSPPPSQPLGFLGGSRCARLRYAMCLFWGADPCCDSLGGCQPPRIPRSLGRQMGACLQFCRGCPSGAEIAPFWLWLPPPASLSPASAQQLALWCSVLCSVSGPGSALG